MAATAMAYEPCVARRTKRPSNTTPDMANSATKITRFQNDFMISANEKNISEIVNDVHATIQNCLNTRLLSEAAELRSGLHDMKRCKSDSQITPAMCSTLSMPNMCLRFTPHRPPVRKRIPIERARFIRFRNSSSIMSKNGSVNEKEHENSNAQTMVKEKLRKSACTFFNDERMQNSESFDKSRLAHGISAFRRFGDKHGVEMHPNAQEATLRVVKHIVPIYVSSRESSFESFSSLNTSDGWCSENTNNSRLNHIDDHAGTSLPKACVSIESFLPHPHQNVRSPACDTPTHRLQQTALTRFFCCISK